MEAASAVASAAACRWRQLQTRVGVVVAIQFLFLRKGAAGRSPTVVRLLPPPTPAQGRVMNIACCQICGHRLNLEWRSGVHF